MKKFRPKYEKECFEIEQELNKTGGYSSNLKKVIDFAVKICQNPFLLWDSGDLNSKKVFQNLLFPEGICYNREFDLVRTPKINTFFPPIPELARVLNGQKNGTNSSNLNLSRNVIPTVQNSNHLIAELKLLGELLTVDTD